MEGSKSKSGDKAAPQKVDGYTPPDGAELLGTDKGFIGEAVDPRPNSDYSLESGPDSPSALDASIDAAKARVDALEASSGNQTA